tara:strand:- start:68 stop:508 length:441 start_codon:yes stop_codon:yes gene_type:complete
MNINNINDINTPQNAFMVNQYTESNDRSNCNPSNSPNNFGNYFNKCSIRNSSPVWGSNKPVKENCMNPMMGKPCHNIWNNSTKRKTIVYYDRGQIINKLDISKQDVIPSNRLPGEPPMTKVDENDAYKIQSITFPSKVCNCNCNCK